MSTYISLLKRCYFLFKLEKYIFVKIDLIEEIAVSQIRFAAKCFFTSRGFSGKICSPLKNLRMEVDYFIMQQPGEEIKLD